MLIWALVIAVLTFAPLSLAFTRLVSLAPHIPLGWRARTAWFPAIGSGLALLATWALMLLLNEPATVPLLGGLFLSSMGVPLALNLPLPGLVILAAWASIQLAQVLSARQPASAQQLVAWLSLPALALVVAPNNLLTLLVGLGGLDGLMLLAALSQACDARAALTRYILHSVSLVLMFAFVVAHTNTGSSLVLDRAQLASPAAEVFVLSAMLRLGIIHAAAAAPKPADLLALAGGLGLLSLLSTMQATPPPAWFAVATAASAGLNGLSALATQTPALSKGKVLLGSAQWAALAALSSRPWAAASAAAVWLVSSAWLLEQHAPPSQVWLRRVSAVGAIGAPLATFVLAQAPGDATLPSLGTVLTMLVMIAIGGVNLAALWRLAAHQSAQSSARAHLGAIAAPAFMSLQWLATLALWLAHGPVQDADVTAAALNIVGIMLLTAGGWALHRVRTNSADAAGEALARASSVEWVVSLIAGALKQLCQPFRNWFDLLEREGVLLWAIAAALLILLFSTSTRQ
ncbi:MAG: hypothetical protein ACK4WM_06430 [Thermoflexales bacterium]